MMADLRNWFAGLSRREQWLVRIASGLTAWVLVVFGIIMPALSAIDAAKLELDEAVQRRGRIEATVEAGARQKPAAQASNADIDLIVTQSAAEQGFDLVKSAPGGQGQLSFRIDQARAPALLAWLSGLEAQGVGVRTITLRSSSSGRLTVDAQLQKVAR
jgi:general secretion pathway protein M